MKTALTIAIATLFALSSARAGEEVLFRPAVPPSPAATAEDPFADLLRDYPSEIVKTGPSCSIVKIQLPPGVDPAELGF